MRPENLVFEHYHEYAEKINPIVRAALAGELKIEGQKQRSEAWLGLALFGSKGLVPLEEVVASADAINHLIPSPNEVAWAFLCLKKRGWLAIERDSYGLTSEGRRAIDTILSQDHFERLTEWILNNPPVGPKTAKDVFLELGKRKVNSK
jgi:hypothetical protein